MRIQDVSKLELIPAESKRASAMEEPVDSDVQGPTSSMQNTMLKRTRETLGMTNEQVEEDAYID